MKQPRDTNRRTVLKTLGAGVAGGTALTGTVSAHGGGGRDFRLPSWFENSVWELTARPGGLQAAEESHAPIWHLEPGIKGCPQVPPNLVPTPTFGKNATKAFDQTLSANPFNVMWHIHWVFEAGTTGTKYSDLVNTAKIDLDGSGEIEEDNENGVDETAVPLTSGSRIRQAADPNTPAGKQVRIYDTGHAFNCPIRPADENHSNYCP